MHRRARILLVIALAMLAHILVYEWGDVPARRWVVKGKLGQFGYEQWDYDRPGSPHSYRRNTTSLYVGPFKLTAPLSAASFFLLQVTAPLVVWSLVRGRRRKEAGGRREIQDEVNNGAFQRGEVFDCSRATGVSRPTA